ncbi:hypothetical protein HanXRQr2_Chr16g0743381 [Helianthus annuus]|uniref:Uncharacterized protein n=1 Tax=Helianthus annuus TaxID=4232 RepID=A0A9K3DQ74_HELAN|nr:hypothetical protein HanXRQr2_Chr16g0743381 [Helianthus annuus]
MYKEEIQAGRGRERWLTTNCKCIQTDRERDGLVNTLVISRDRQRKAQALGFLTLLASAVIHC